MAERIVLLGWGDEAYEIDWPLDADLLVKHKQCRVSFSLRGGDLATAVVLYPHKRLLGIEMENATEHDFREAIRMIGMLVKLKPITVTFSSERVVR